MKYTLEFAHKALPGLPRTIEMYLWSQRNIYQLIMFAAISFHFNDIFQQTMAILLKHHLGYVLTGAIIKSFWHNLICAEHVIARRFWENSDTLADIVILIT